MKRSLDGQNIHLPPGSKQVLENENKEPSLPLTLNAPVSPPRRQARSKRSPTGNQKPSTTESAPNLAAIEAGKVDMTDHLAIISSSLSRCARPVDLVPGVPRLPITDWVELYRRNCHPKGRHFVIHQHDHPVAGPHYDLRLQFSETSSVSWSIMYGLPGDPNSRRLNRNATETRVHCLWNHLIETASARTGSMIIWDTGEYEILPSQTEPDPPETEDSRSELSDTSSPPIDEKSDSEKLRQAFHNHKIRLRLHGTRLPEHYTIILRLDKNLDFKPSTQPPRKRRRGGVQVTPARSRTSTSSDSHSNDESDPTETDHQIRVNNAYPGSTNTIGSIHQRRWFATLDRVNSGFAAAEGTGSATTGRGKKRWVRRRDVRTGREFGFEPFYVRGPDVERSVVTGRLGGDVLGDEGVEGFVSRRGWRAVLE